MDYKEKYEAALERARMILCNIPEGESCKDIETIFPELAESEDEGTRKELIGMINECTNWLHKKEYVKYLEKQKENPKNADSISADCVSNAKCEDRWHKVGDSLPDNPREVLCKDEAGNYFIGRYYVGEGWEISNYDDEDKPHHLNPPVSKWIDLHSEKQKEQKQEVEDDLDKEIYRFFDDCIDVHEAKLYGSITERVIPVDCYELTARHFAKWAEKQKEQNSPDSTGLYYYDGKKFTCCGFPYNFTMNQQEEQKTVAISENNNSDTNGHLTGKILVEYGAHAKVRDGKRHCEMDWKEFQRLAHYFYELGKTEQKPAGDKDSEDNAVNIRMLTDPKTGEKVPFVSYKDQEWNEEDERILKGIIGLVDHDQHYGVSNNEMISWLKSLRPRWRPGEEQMEALSDTLEFMPDTFKPRCTLVTLQNDLRKLM